MSSIFAYWGADARSYHHWQLSPLVQLSEILKFEEKAGVELPMEYVYYLTQVGSGGTNPGTFFSDFKSEWRSYDGDLAPMWPKGSLDFLTWCENFYSELLAGYDIHPTWKFMWQEPGDTDALIRAFNDQKDSKYQKEVLYSFRKFQRLSKEAYCFLKNIQHPEFQEIAAEIIEYFDHKKL